MKEVIVICWDNKVYKRNANNREIARKKRYGNAIEYAGNIIFDFRNGLEKKNTPTIQYLQEYEIRMK